MAIILKVKDYLNFKVTKFTLRKTIFKSNPELHFLLYPVENVYGIVIRTKNQIDFVSVSFYLHMKGPRALRSKNAPPTKLTHIIMTNSCFVPLTDTGMEIGDRHYIWGQNGVKDYDP